MIDRTARDQVVEAIDRFLNDETDNFEFDAQLWDIDSEDETVAYAVETLWFHYDDCTCHRAVLTKGEWDLIQRIRLLLLSEAEVSRERESRWSWDHALACAGFLSFSAIAFLLGIGWPLWIIAIPFGLISMGISRYRDRSPMEYFPKDLALYPFASVTRLRKVRRRVPGFSKQSYRVAVGSRRIRSRTTEKIIAVYSFVLQIFCGPIALLFQGIPSPARETVAIAPS